MSHDHGKPDTAVNREEPERIVESDECFEAAAVDEALPQTGGAVVHRESPRHDQADAATPAADRQRAFEKGLVQIQVAAPASSDRRPIRGRTG